MTSNKIVTIVENIFFRQIRESEFLIIDWFIRLDRKYFNNTLWLGSLILMLVYYSILH